MQVKGKGRFKLDFVCVLLQLGDATSIRALIISVAEIGSSTHLMAACALENGVVQQMPIRRDLFLAAQGRGDVVTLGEQDGQQGELILFGPDGRNLRWNRAD